MPAEICTLDCGTMNFAEADYVMTNTPGMLRAMGRMMTELGVKPEIEAFDTGHLWFAKQLVEDGVLTLARAGAAVHGRALGRARRSQHLHGDGQQRAARLDLVGLLAGAQPDGLCGGRCWRAAMCASGWRTTSGWTRACWPPTRSWSSARWGSSRTHGRAGDRPGRGARAAIIGGGVIGGGWAARFLLNGWDVRVFDPDPQAARKLGEVLDNARRALPGLMDAPMPPEGRLSLHGSLDEAVAGADWIQESVPERLDLKQDVYAEIEAAAGPDALIDRSSTSGFKPSELQEAAPRPAGFSSPIPSTRSTCCRWSNWSRGEANPGATIERARAILTGIGMHPLHRPQGDRRPRRRPLPRGGLARGAVAGQGRHRHHRGDRRRDPLRLRLRWAQMGLFETYRIAGGEAGHAPFHGPVRPLPEMALDQADGRARLHRRARRPDRRPVRRAIGRPFDPRCSNASATTTWCRSCGR
jgi:hypothetical protein